MIRWCSLYLQLYTNLRSRLLSILKLSRVVGSIYFIFYVLKGYRGVTMAPGGDGYRRIGLVVGSGLKEAFLQEKNYLGSSSGSSQPFKTWGTVEKVVTWSLAVNQGIRVPTCRMETAQIESRTRKRFFPKLFSISEKITNFLTISMSELGNYWKVRPFLDIYDGGN